jgi:hypothetical protein
LALTIRYECEVVLCQRREPTFNQPPIEGSFCDTEGGCIADRSVGVGAGGQFFVWRALQGGSDAERKKMFDRTVKLRVSRQSIVLGISWGSVYYR